MVPRDALLLKFGGNVVFTIRDGVAQQHFVEVIGYQGMFTGISNRDLSPAELYVVQGHERLRNGDRVEIVGAPTSPVSVQDSDD